MSDKAIDEAFKLEIKRKNFVRAAHLASSPGFGEDRLRDIRSKALWRMGCYESKRDWYQDLSKSIRLFQRRSKA